MRAAGGTINGTFDKVKERIVSECKKHIDTISNE